MASPRPYSPPITRGRRAREAASSDRLPTDVLFNVLLRFPARELCRLRAVCRSWRSLTSDPVFITAHAARHPGPLFLAQFRDDKTHSIYIVDLSGNVVKRIAGAAGGPYHRLQCTRLDLACLTTDWNRCHVLNPATGAVQALPEGPAVEHVNRVNLRDPYTFFALGWVSSTGDYKVLRMFNRLGFAKGGHQLFEVFTINGGAAHARWRGQQSPGLFVDECSGVVVDGVVYFLTSRTYDGARYGIRPDYIVSFDLGREEWRRDLRGPISSRVGSASSYMRHHLTLAELKGSLVIADRRHQPFTLDLWFLVDSGSGHWVKEYHILTGPAISRPVLVDESFKPLLLLDDGRLVVYVATRGQLFIQDPGTDNFARVYMGRLDSVSVYTGNLLSRG
ncbi:F-box/kelch-repeat protein At3g23880-like [Miscanthus floridulus]|uniref:F-box/kelch-repeat protein At3g23880-like n=1 Tax=Miscanthus floridulus TaxID=154761 RepID=UPI0034584F42